LNWIANLLLCVLAVVVLCGAKPLDKGKYIGVEELKSGMKGYGLTVFKGTKPEKFGVEIIDVVPQMSPIGRPGQDAVIVRISGHDLEFTQIASGMSGSPVYFKGRLAGALAFGWAFGKGAVCGMTPIKHMIEAQEEAERRGDRRATACLERAFGWEESVRFIPGVLRRYIPGAPPAPSLGGRPAGEKFPAAVMKPVMPVVCSGLSSDAIELLNRHLLPNRMMAVAGGSASRPSPAVRPEMTRPVKLEPGAAIGIRFSEGDMELAGIGTLTCFHEGRMLAFGHGMFQSGRIAMPVASAWVHGLIPSSFMSFKLSTPLKTVGAMDYDGVAAVLGRLGAKVPMLPMKLVVYDGVGELFGANWLPKGGGRVHRCRSIRHYMWTPLVGATFFGAFIPHQGGLPRLSTARASFTIELADGRRIRYADMAAGPGAPRYFAGQMLMILLDLYNNPFREADLKSVTVETAWTRGLKVASIESQKVARKEVSPGEEVEIELDLLAYQGGRKSATVKIKIPRDMPYGPRTIRIAGFDDYFRSEVAANPRRFRPRTFDELLDVLTMSRRRDKLYGWFDYGEFGLSLGDVELPSLSAPALQLFTADAERRSGAMPIYKNIVTSIDVPYLVSGQIAVTVNIVPPEEK